MPAICENWGEAVVAVDAFERSSERHKNVVSVIFGGVASPPKDDNSDILTSRAIQQRVLDLLDEPPERWGLVGGSRDGGKASPDSDSVTQWPWPSAEDYDIRPVTGQNRGSKYEVRLPHLPFLTDGSTANVQGIASDETADKALFLRKLGDLPASAMAEIEQALLFAVGMAK